MYSKRLPYRNFGLLSFGEEAEEDEEETNQFVQKNAGKAKSMHDVVDDPKLSKDALRIEDTNIRTDDELEEERKLACVKEEPVDDDDIEERRQRIKDKLQLKAKETKNIIKTETAEIKNELSDSDEDVLLTQEQDHKIKSELKR